MNSRYPYAPDMNAPTGIPKGYPYGPTPMPSTNPLLPNSSYPYPTSNSAYPATMSSYPFAPVQPSVNPPYPPSVPSFSSTVSYPPTSSYPSAAEPPMPPYRYPASNNAPYPSTTSSHVQPNPGFQYPTSGLSYPSASNFPSGSAHMGVYPSVNPSQHYNISGSNVINSSFQGYPKLSTMTQFMYEGTVKPFPGFDAQQDAQELRKAMKGFGTDEKAIINVLAKRSNAQRVYISIAFKQMFGKDLIDDLKSELSGNFEDVIIALMTPTNDYLASEVHSAISGIGTNEDILIEVLCTRTNQEIWGINESYKRLYGKSMEDDIKSDTSGHFERLMISTCTGARSDAPADETRAKQNAHALYAAGVGQWGTDESTFNAILVSESFQQLALTFYEYQKLAGHTVTEAIDKEMSGDLRKGMLAIAHCVENRPFYFAEKLYKAMKGLGTDDRTLIRVVVSRCELDMVQIKAEYERNYGKPLADAIKGDTSGDYRRVLIALVDGY